MIVEFFQTFPLIQKYSICYSRQFCMYIRKRISYIVVDRNNKKASTLLFLWCFWMSYIEHNIKSLPINYYGINWDWFAINSNKLVFPQWNIRNLLACRTRVTRQMAHNFCVCTIKRSNTFAGFSSTLFKVLLHDLWHVIWYEIEFHCMDRSNLIEIHEHCTTLSNYRCDLSKWMNK